MKKRRFNLKQTICMLLLCFVLFEQVKNCIYVVRHGVVSLTKTDEYNRPFVVYKGKKYYELSSFGNSGGFSFEDCDLDPLDEIGYRCGKNILSYLIPYPNMFKYYFYKVKYDPNGEFIMHMGLQSDTRAIYIREDILNEFCKRNILITCKERCLRDGSDISDYDVEELTRYVKNESYGELVIIDNEKGEHVFIMDKSYLQVLNDVRTEEGKKVEFNKDILLKSSYQLRFYENELPKPKLSDYLLVINDQYIYVRLNENDKDNTKVIGTIIEDESVIESIEDGGKQIFTKENGVTIDNVEYVNG
ncbi:MAG: hypothetical protein IKL07_08575 [Clostridium sp.]|nr:hypothetical protein [Clostridium sp.]